MCKYLFDYNEDVYRDMIDYLKIDNKALVNIDTGLGKTTTALQYAEDNHSRLLVVCPNNTIKRGWEDENCDGLADTITYSAFRNKYKEVDYSKYCAVVCDETHHAGAPTWGEGIKYLIDNNVIPVIGLTATPTRSDKVNVGNSIFGGNICTGIKVSQGIKDGILHPFSYVGAFYDTEGVADEYVDCASEQLIGKLNVAIQNTPSVHDILMNDMPSGKRKGIIFASDIADMNDAVNIMKEVYPNAEYKYLHSQLSSKEQEENREWFKNTDEGYLCTVNMINEGAHYNGVNTIIMLRKTTSEIVFKQQMGRIITKTTKEDPNGIVFDFVNNAKLIQTFKEITEAIKVISGNGGIIIANNSNPGISGQHIVKDYTTNITEVLDEIEAELSDDYEDWEEEIIKKYYESEGPKGCSERIAKERERRHVG